MTFLTLHAMKRAE